MIQYFIRRVLGLIPLLLGITLITFFVMQLAPGKPTDLVTDLNVKMTPQAKEHLIKLYGLDQPIYVRYLKWLKATAKLDFGTSFRDGKPVIKKIGERLPAT